MLGLMRGTGVMIDLATLTDLETLREEENSIIRTLEPEDLVVTWGLHQI